MPHANPDGSPTPHPDRRQPPRLLRLLPAAGTRRAHPPRGFDGALAGIFGNEQVPYSNLGTGKWVISDPELGYRLNPAGDEINELSIRHAEITMPKPAGVFRVVVLGDSIPWDRGGFVSSLAGQLAARGSVEVVNAAVPGYTSYQEVRFFGRYLLRTEPDLVVWTYCLNDNHRFLHRFDAAAQMLFTPEAMESLEIRSWWDWIVSRSYVLSSLRLGLLGHRRAVSAAQVAFSWEARPDFNIAWKDYSWRAYAGHLREMVRLLDARRARLAVVIFPYEPQLDVRTRRDVRDYALKPQAQLLRLCRKYDVPCLDLYPTFEAAYDRGAKLYRDQIHLNEEGHRLSAAEILRFLDDRRLLPPAAKQ
ncbi:MAG: SGNH/GDSL hydrolase family protein [Candidatus Binatia bacterium]